MMSKSEIIRKLKALCTKWDDERVATYGPAAVIEFGLEAKNEINNILEQFTEEEIQAAIMKE